MWFWVKYSPHSTQESFGFRYKVSILSSRHMSHIGWKIYENVLNMILLEK